MLRVLSLFFLLSFVPCHAFVDRVYKHEAFCHKHQKFVDPQITEDLLSLIPDSPVDKCASVDCSSCGCTWVEELELKNGEGSAELVDFVPFCECKEAERKEYERLWEIYLKLSIIHPQKYPRPRYPGFDRMPTWTDCNEPGIYPGYFDCNLQRYMPLFKKYLQYVKSNPRCSCFWSERSTLAQEANNCACTQFFELFQNTCLKDVAGNPKRQCQLGLMSKECLTTYGLILQCTTHSFFYRDYVDICDELYQYSLNITDYSCSDIIDLRVKLDRILDEIRPYFVDMYEICIEKHPSNTIEEEFEYLKWGNYPRIQENFDNIECKTIDNHLCEYPNNLKNRKIGLRSRRENPIREGKLLKDSKKSKKNISENVAGDSVDFLIHQGRSLSDFFLYNWSLDKTIAKLVTQ